jgi:hypothetical protein
VIREVILVFYGLVGSFVLGVFSLVIVDGVFQKIMNYANLQEGDPMYGAVPLLSIFATAVMFIPLEVAFIYISYFYLRNVWREAEAWV